MDNLVEKQKLRILFFASDPSDESRLHLGKELQSIRDRLKDNNDFEIKDHLATKYSDIMKEIMNYKPQIVHFSGHGTTEGELRFEDETGNARSIPPNALASLFRLTKDFVKCVIVNTCYSEIQAKDLFSALFRDTHVNHCKSIYVCYFWVSRNNQTCSFAPS